MMTPPVWLRLYWREMALLLAILLPWAALAALGALWLYDHDAWLYWFVGGAFLGLATWPLRRTVRARFALQAADRFSYDTKTSGEWGPREHAAMQKIEEIALNSPPLTFTKFDDARDLALRVVRAVASHYHPHSKLPEFAIPAPHLLLLVEKAAREYRDTMLWIPAANELKMDTIFNWTQTSGKWAPMAKMVYKIADHAWTAVRLYAEPQTGMSRLIKGHFLGQAGGTVLDAAYRSATRWLVASLGREAINLYSGRLSHSDRELVEASQRDAATARQSRMAPPRFLLAGQINAGKSSLINALANEVLSDVRPVPTTSDVAEHVLTIEGEECAILVDMTGLTNDDASRAALFDQVARCDAIIWVSSATQPGRDADVRALTALRGKFQEAPHDRHPPIVVALTQVDRLTPASEWDPPYDFVEPTRPKERTMRDVMDHVAETLGTSIDAVVPVSLAPGIEPWNVEYLWARVARDLDAAKCRQLQRLRTTKGSWLENIAGVGTFAVQLAGGLARNHFPTRE